MIRTILTHLLVKLGQFNSNRVFYTTAKPYHLLSSEKLHKSMNFKLIQQTHHKISSINNSNANIFIIQMQICIIVKIENELLNNSFEFYHVKFSNRESWIILAFNDIYHKYFHGYKKKLKILCKCNKFLLPERMKNKKEYEVCFVTDTDTGNTFVAHF